MDIFDRIQYLVDREAAGNVNNFSKRAGINPETIRSALKKRRSFPGYEVLSKILLHYSHINPDWLMLGNEPINRPQNFTVQEPIERYMSKEDRYLSIIESQQRTIENLSTEIKNSHAHGETNALIGKGA